MEATTDVFTLLPKEIVLCIYDYLIPEDLSRACGACKQWNLLMSSDLLWRKFVAPKKSLSAAKNSDNDQDIKPFKWIYINRKVNWLHGHVEKFTIPGHSTIGGSFYIAHMLTGQNILLTGSRGDIMEEWDLAERKLIKSYEVPTGPASSYRMDDEMLVINRNSLIRWKRHDQSTRMGKDDEFSFKLQNFESFESYKFVRERLLTVGAGNIKLYDMNTGQQMWSIPCEQRVTWNGIDMDYNRAIIAAGNSLLLLDLNEGKEILRINGPSNEMQAVCQLKGNLVCWATSAELCLVDLRQPDQRLWSMEITEHAIRYNIRKIYFDEFKCIISTYDHLLFFDTQNGKLLYKKDCAGIIDFACNDEYLVALTGRDPWILDFTKRVDPPKEEEIEPPKEDNEWDFSD